MKTKLMTLLIGVLIVLLSTLETKSQEASLRLKILSASDTACFNREELQTISQVFIENEKLSERIIYQSDIISNNNEQIDILSSKVEVLDKETKECNKNLNVFVDNNKALNSHIGKLKLTRNIAIGVGGLFAIIAIAK